MNNGSENQAKSKMPAYVSYQTFLAFIEYLKQKGIPHQLDSSAWSPNLSGASRSALKSSLQFLGLIDNDSRPTEMLEQLVGADESDRKTSMELVFKQAYGDLIADLDLEKSTPYQIKSLLRGEGDTKEKQYSFLVNMAKDAEIKLSQFVISATRRSQPKRGGKRPKRNQNPKDETVDNEDYHDDIQNPAEKVLVLLQKNWDFYWPKNVKDDFDAAGNAIIKWKNSLEEYQQNKK